VLLRRNVIESESPRVVVVGTCASGKSTLVSALRELGVDAYVCAQEHSEVPTLWNHAHPDFVVLLEADLQTIRKRRSPTWPESIFLEQQRRLLNARAAANVIIDTDVTGVDQAVALVRESLERAQSTESS
jgi:broad-specificity NMP kinase